MTAAELERLLGVVVEELRALRRQQPATPRAALQIEWRRRTARRAVLALEEQLAEQVRRERLHRSRRRRGGAAA